MAVAFLTNTSALGSAQNPTFNITVSGTNPVLIIDVGLDSTTETVSSVSWSLGSGTALEIKNVRNSTAFSSVWAIPAPGAGAGTVTVNKSAASINHQIDVQVWTGADQTTPCPTGDAVTSIVHQAATTLTPTNLTANDGTAGNGINTVGDTPTSVTPNQRYLNSTTSVNQETGDATGTTGVTLNYALDIGNLALVAVRIAASAAVSATNPSPSAPSRRMISWSRRA